LTTNEARSPRGRIALVQAMESGVLPPSEHLHALLDDCLLCRRCERVCPSGVPFGRIMDAGRARTRAFSSLRERAAIALVTRPRLAAGLVAAAGLLRPLLPADSLVARLVGRSRSDRIPAPGFYPAVGKERGRVGLFTGCAGHLLDAETLHSAVRLLIHAGFGVHVPTKQTCCGALDAHGGNAARARMLQERNESAFAEAGRLKAVVSVASGCGAHLTGYAGLGARHRDIGDFLLDSFRAGLLRFGPLHARVLVHTPCTLENVLQASEAVPALLRWIPGLELEESGGRGQCCGAGGLTFLSHPGLSRALRAPLVAQIARAAPDFVVTSNAGCGFHLQQGAGRPEYLHPVTLLARQLITD
jgi:glycolate oxidase iron-sulfur subunit